MTFHALAVDRAQSLQVDDVLARGELEHLGDVGGWAGALEGEDLVREPPAARPDLLREPGQALREVLVHLRRRHERALALVADDQPLVRELGERLAHHRAADAVVLAQLRLARQLLADGNKAVGHRALEDDPELLVVGDARGPVDHGRAALGQGRAGRPAQSASCWYATDWKDRRCSGEMPWAAIASRCSGVE